MTQLAKLALAAAVLALPFAASAEEAPETMTVTIAAYVDGAPATTAATSAGGDSFPMVSYWSAKNIGHDDGAYSLGPSGFNSPTPYTAVTSDMSVPASYATRAVLSWNKSEDGSHVSGNCRTGKKYTLEGYSVGSTMDEAEDAGPSKMPWAKVSKATDNQYMIVWYRHCLEAPEHLSPKNGAVRTTATQQLIDWADVTSPYGTVHYIYQSAHSRATNPDGSFVSPVYTSGALSSSEINTPDTPPALYYWHIQAIDSAGNKSWWSNPWKLKVN